MVIIPPSLSWKDVSRNFVFFVKDLGENTWAVGCYDLKGRERIVDFQDKVVPTFFKSEILVTSIVENLDLIFNYLQCRGTDKATNVAAALCKLFSVPNDLLPSAREYLTIHWDDVPKDTGWAPLDAVEFSNHTWGIVANLPEGDYLVLFDFNDPGVRTFHLTESSADETIKILFGYERDERIIDERFRRVAAGKTAQPLKIESSKIPKPPVNLSFDPAVSVDVETVLGIRDDWYRRKTGVGKHCFCHRCVSRDQATLIRIRDRYPILDPELVEALLDAQNWLPVR